MGGGLLIGNEMIWIWFIWDVKKVFSLKQIIRLRIWTSHGMAGQTKKAYPQQTLKPTCFNDKILELMTLFQLGILIFFHSFVFWLAAIWILARNVPKHLTIIDRFRAISSNAMTICALQVEKQKFQTKKKIEMGFSLDSLFNNK